jgi:hypothetical protein
MASGALASGPGLGQLTYEPEELFQPISVISTPSGEGFVHMVDGYLFVPFSKDGNKGFEGGMAVYDMSDPRNPVPVYTHRNADTETMLEPHGYGFSEGKLAYCTLTGIIVWDISDLSAPQKLGSLPLGSGSGYGHTCWSVSYQAPYAYVGTGTGGLHVVDLTDPTEPVLLNSLSTAQLGGVPIHNVHVVGNLLVATRSQSGAGYVTVDISNPATPTLITADSSTNVPSIYSAHLNGNRLYGMGVDSQLYIHDISDPSQYVFEGSVGSGSIERGGYATNQDSYVFGGYSNRVAKFDVQDPVNPVLVGHGTAARVVKNMDQDFAVVMGNLIFNGNDHRTGSAVMVHQTEPDTTGPSVNMVSPADGSPNQALSSRIGITLTDMVLIESVNQSSFIVRPQGGSPLTGTYSVQFDKVNFWPDAPLQEDTVYEVVIPAGGIQDWSGNASTSEFVSTFSTGPTPPAGPAPALACSINPGVATQVDATAVVSGQVANADGSVLFKWAFGDGQASPLSIDNSATHAYTAAGNYAVVLTVFDQSSSASCSGIQVVHNPLSTLRPTRSTSIVFHAGEGFAYNVNPDNDTVTAVGEDGNKVWEAQVGKKPTTLAEAPSGHIWVVNRDDATVSVVNAATGNLIDTHVLPYASRPFGIAFAPDRSAAYVSLEGTGELLKLDVDSGQILGALAVNPKPRGIAVSGDSARILVSRFISPQSHGQVTEVNASDFTVGKTILLAVDAGPDTEASGRGVPNYLSSVSISPDGLTASVPSKKDNTLRGQFRDGQPLTFESTVRAIISQLDLSAGQENVNGRVDMDDSNLPIDSLYSEFGNQLFVALLGSNRVEVRDAYDISKVLGVIEDTGLAPTGLAFNADFSRLFVHNFLSRSVEIYDVTGFKHADSFVADKLSTVDVVAAEKLDDQILLGKQIFYNSDDLRMSRDGYLSCISCHLDDTSDERVWDFTDRGEGLRNTISLLGRRGMGQGNVHWTANFDEIQDFENDIRGSFGGTGFMSDDDFNAGTRSDPLGDPKSGLSKDLDALAAYVASLDEGHPSPYRRSDGSLSAEAQAGKVLFEGIGGCLSCHTGPDFTDTLKHDVGTVQAHSGRASGQPLSGTGFETPTLLGIWETAPYLHDGSAATLFEVIENASHGKASAFTPTEKDELVAYLLALEVGGASQRPLPVEANDPVVDTLIEEPTATELDAASGGGGGGCTLARTGQRDWTLSLLALLYLFGLLLRAAFGLKQDCNFARQSRSGSD